MGGRDGRGVHCSQSAVQEERTVAVQFDGGDFGGRRLFELERRFARWSPACPEGCEGENCDHCGVAVEVAEGAEFEQAVLLQSR